MNSISNKKRWISLIASCIVAFCLGSAYTWSVFTTPLAERLNEILGLSGSSAYVAGDLSVVFSTYSLISIVAMIFGGALVDKFGPKWIIFTAGIMLAFGYVLCGQANSIILLILAFGVITCLGCASAYSCALNNSIKLFPEKKGLVAGLVTATYGLSPVILSPVANAMISRVGVSKTFMFWGIAFGILVVSASAFTVKSLPAAAAAGGTPATNANDKNTLQMIRDPLFYVMVLILASGAFFGIMFTSLVSGISLERMAFTPAKAAAMASLLSLGSASGRLICGYISDKLGRINTITGLLTVACVGLVLMSTTAPDTVLRYQVAVAILGFCFGAIMSTFPGFTADQFGTTYNGLNYGIMWIGYSVSGTVAPVLTSSVYKSTGSYNSAFFMAIGFTVVGILMTFVFRIVKSKRNAAAADAQ